MLCTYQLSSHICEFRKGAKERKKKGLVVSVIFDLPKNNWSDESATSDEVPYDTLDLIIPIYNESSRLKLTFQALNSFIPPRVSKISKVIFVNDGSTDSSLKKIKSARLKFLKRSFPIAAIR